MILNPAIIALIASSLLITAYAVYASTIGFQILAHWDIKSGSDGQLVLERKTYLISTLLAYLFGLSLFSLFLFIYTADHVHNLFVGAMCAAGSLNVNPYGYPALVVKIINFFLCGVFVEGIAAAPDEHRSEVQVRRHRGQHVFGAGHAETGVRPVNVDVPRIPVWRDVERSIRGHRDQKRSKQQIDEREAGRATLGDQQHSVTPGTNGERRLEEQNDITPGLRFQP